MTSWKNPALLREGEKPFDFQKNSKWRLLAGKVFIDRFIDVFGRFSSDFLQVFGVKMAARDSDGRSPFIVRIGRVFA